MRYDSKFRLGWGRFVRSCIIWPEVEILVEALLSLGVMGDHSAVRFRGLRRGWKGWVILVTDIYQWGLLEIAVLIPAGLGLDGRGMYELLCSPCALMEDFVIARSRFVKGSVGKL